MSETLGVPRPGLALYVRSVKQRAHGGPSLMHGILGYLSFQTQSLHVPDKFISSSCCDLNHVTILRVQSLQSKLQ